MSYQPPYTPQYSAYTGYNPIVPLLAPARRAGVLIIVLGALTILSSACFGVMGAFWTEISREMTTEQIAQFTKLEAEGGIAMAKLIYVFAAGCGFLGMLYIVLGILCRSGNLVVLIVSMIPLVLTILYLLGTLLFAPGIESGILFMLVGIPHLLAGMWLIQAMINSSKIREIQLQQQMQMWQYQMQMQQYQMGGYQYGQPNQPQPPADPSAGA